MLIIGLLGLIFVTLKLTGYIFWAWYLVLTPFMVIGLFYGIMAVAGAMAGAMALALNF